MKSQIIDASIWEELRAFGEDDESSDFFPKLLLTFLTHSKKQMSDLVESSQSGDIKKTLYYSHSLKSACATLGALNLAQHLSEVELACAQAVPEIKMLTIMTAHEIFQALIVEVQCEYDIITNKNN
jgi:HPt (histidine-containing phosphotransfer) domain-containing protein